MSIKASVASSVVKQELRRIREDPAKRLPELVNWAHSLDKSGKNEGMFRTLDQVAKDPSNNWNIMINTILKNVHPSIQEKFVSNFAVNSAFISAPKREKIMKREGCNIPWAILMDPTASCNLHCTGCWAADYRKTSNLDYATLDRIITEGRQLGIYMYIYSGGEPLVRSEDIFRLAEHHKDCMFLSFTNATMVDEHFAEESCRLGNILLAISIEGYEKETDMRRGAGTYQKVLDAMHILKSHGVPFGFSTCYHHYNADIVGSDEWLDFMVEQGSYFGWYFTYMPLGQDARLDLLATPDDREFMYHQVRKSREKRPLFLIDFWNDGEFSGGCIAGGRSYLHINADGDVEPCAFIHYSGANIHDMSLLDTLKQPLFKEYANNQPFNENMLRPCPLLDNQGKLQAMVERSGAHSTQLPIGEDVAALTEKCRTAADAWEERANLLWE
ncbi:MAG: radical SAM protein [Spirochaetaceae bacterium]|nr:radical SAM protein [Spirochaetaceae bacterium]